MPKRIVPIEARNTLTGEIHQSDAYPEIAALMGIKVPALRERLKRPSDVVYYPGFQIRRATSAPWPTPKTIRTGRPLRVFFTDGSHRDFVSVARCRQVLSLDYETVIRGIETNRWVKNKYRIRDLSYCRAISAEHNKLDYNYNKGAQP